MTVCFPHSSVAVALGGLTLWHFILISRGETSVERHLNRKESTRLWEMGKVDTALFVHLQRLFLKNFTVLSFLGIHIITVK